MPENQQEESPENDLNDEEIAELANKEIKERDAEIAKLKKELAKAKLYSKADEEDETPISREECIKVLDDPRTTNYDYAQAVVNLVDLELADGKPNPLGIKGQEVYNFFKDVLEECDGDKTRFPSIYQARIGADPTEIAMAYNKRKNKN